MDAGACPSCHLALPAEARFCPSCGQAVVRSTGLAVPTAVGKLAAGAVARDWVLDELDDWLASDSEPWMVITGEPGAGKTVLAAWICGAAAPAGGAARLDRIGSLIGAAHFCLPREGGSVDARRFTRRLAEQLGERYEGFGRAAAEVLGVVINAGVQVSGTGNTTIGATIQNLVVRGVGADELYAHSIRDPLLQLAAAGGLAPTIVVVDGLELAEDASATSIVDLLAASGDLPPSVRLLLTSRSEATLLDRFGDARRLDLSSDRWSAHVDADIDRFVAEHVTDAADASRITAAAEGNFQYARFVVDELTLGIRTTESLDALPSGLFGMYRSYLDRIVPRDRFEEVWSDQLRPLLGKVSVATPIAPRPALEQWVEGHVDIAAGIRRVEPLTEYLQADDGWRLFHRSLNEFLATDAYVEREQRRPNDFFVRPLDQHGEIVAFYTGHFAGRWDECDAYGLRALPGHVAAQWRGVPVGDRRRATLAGALVDLVLDDGYRQAQVEHLGAEVSAMTARSACDVVLDDGDEALATRFLLALAADPAAERQGVAVDGLLRWAATDPAAAGRLVQALVGADDRARRHVGLSVAAQLHSIDTFRWIALEGGAAVQEEAVLLLATHWRAGEANVADEVLASLREHVKLRAPRQAKRLLVFLGSLSILVYVDNCWEPAVVPAISDTWRFVLRDRLKLHMVNVGPMEAVISAAAGQAYSKRMLDAVLFDDFQDAAAWFAAGDELKAPFRQAIEWLDPAVAPDADVLRTLLTADAPMAQVVASMVLSVHAATDPAATTPTLRALFDDVSADSRLWLLAALAVPIAGTPTDWVPLADELTDRFVAEDRATFLAGAVGPLAGIDLALMATGLTHGKDGTPSPVVGRLLDPATRTADAELADRAVRALAPVSLWHPAAVLAALAAAFSGDAAPPAGDPLRAAVDEVLAAACVVHPDLVGDHLRAVGRERDLADIRAQADTERWRRCLTLVGYFTNGVHQAIHYPLMRRRLLQHGLTTLATARSAKEFLKQYTPEPLRLLRETDYTLAEWTKAE